MEIFDRGLVRRNRNRAAATLSDHDFLLNRTMDGLIDRLKDIKRDFPFALLIGGRGAERSLATLKEAGGIRDLILMDSAENCLPEGALRLHADEEFFPFRENALDMVLSNLTLHTVNDLPGTLLRIRTSLKPDGVFLASLLGGRTLHELRQSMMQAEITVKGGASPHIAPFADKRQMGALLQRAGFALPVVDSDIVTVTYDDPLKLMRDLRFMGEGNCLTDRSRTPPGKALMNEAVRLYREKFTEDDGRVRATFEIIHLIGWAPHASQQKPLRPGSAKNRLADALKTQEHN